MKTITYGPAARPSRCNPNAISSVSIAPIPHGGARVCIDWGGERLWLDLSAEDRKRIAAELVAACADCGEDGEHNPLCPFAPEAPS